MEIQNTRHQLITLYVYNIIGPVHGFSFASNNCRNKTQLEYYETFFFFRIQKITYIRYNSIFSAATARRRLNGNIMTLSPSRSCSRARSSFIKKNSPPRRNLFWSKHNLKKNTHTVLNCSAHSTVRVPAEMTLYKYKLKTNVSGRKKKNVKKLLLSLTQ